MPHILMTGVSTGIGNACARLFAEKGWQVTGTVRDTARVPDGWPEGAVLEALDLSVPGSATALAERVLAGGGCPDVLLNNAGMLQFGPLEDITTEQLTELYQVNVFGQVELIRALIPAMRQRGSGQIVNVTSLGGRIVFPFFAGYNSTKWALEGISEGLWHELKPFGIRVKAIEPGFVETAIWGKVLPDSDEGLPGREEYRPYVKSMRVFEASITDRTTPEECAREIFAAIEDDGDRLRYPVAAYAKVIAGARRWAGDQAEMRFFHERWMGKDS